MNSLFQLMDFRCYYCEVEFQSLIATKEHLQATHSDQPLKFRQITINETTGKRVLVSKQFKKSAESLLQPETDIPKSERSDREKQEEDAFLKTWPQAEARLKEQGLLSDWIALHEIIANGTLPLDNIALLLFLDVVKFYSARKTAGMRYASQTKTFWQTAYKLFGGKLLRFMGGPKGLGQVVEGAAGSTGDCLPSEAKVNFIVPAINSLETQDVEETKPGIMQQCIRTLSQTTSTVKISFDSKKINSSLSASHGDEDLYSTMNKHLH